MRADTRALTQAPHTHIHAHTHPPPPVPSKAEVRQGYLPGAWTAGPGASSGSGVEEPAGDL